MSEPASKSCAGLGRSGLRLDAVGPPALVHPYHVFAPTMRAVLTGGTTVHRELPPWRG